MKVIYIAGPFRDKTPWLVELNIRRAEMMAYKIATQGGVPLCPHTMYRYFNGTQTDDFWIHGTRELLLRSDSIIMLNEWERSEGSRGERGVAIGKQLPIFYEHNMDEFLRYLSLYTDLKDQGN